jgi:HSP20 family protein
MENPIKEEYMSRSLVRRNNPLSLSADPFDFFNAFFADPFTNRDDGLSLKSHVEDTENNYTFTIEVPGFDESEINIEIKDRQLTIKAEHKEGSEGRHFHSSVQRSWSLPRGVKEEDVSATLKNGVLTVLVPKKEIQEVKKIKVLKE